MELPALIISLVALVFSGYSIYQSMLVRKDTARSEAIRESYKTFYELNRLQLDNWELSHIFAMPTRYDYVSRQLANWKKLSPEEHAKLLLKERAVALLIFTVYEQTLYQWRQANAGGDVGRSHFLLEMLNYFTRRVLRNPRLLYYWPDDGDGLKTYFEVSTHEHYNKQVLHDPSNPLKSDRDSKGPFDVKDAGEEKAVRGEKEVQSENKGER